MSSVVDRFEILMSVRRFAEAEACARDMIALYPDWGAAYTHLARVLIELKRYDDALPAAQQGVHKAPHDSWAHATLGLVFERMHRHQDAVDAAHEALRILPTYAYAFGVLSFNYDAMEKFARALQATTEGLKHHPHNMQLLRFHAWNLYRLDRAEEAINVARECLRLHPKSYEALNVLAQVTAVRARQLYIRGRLSLHREAHRYFLDALRLRPDSEDVQRNMRDNAVAFRRWFWPWMVIWPYIVVVSLCCGVIGGLIVGIGFGICYGLATFIIGCICVAVDGSSSRDDDYFLTLPLDRWGLPSIPLESKGGWRKYVTNWRVLVACPPTWGLALAIVMRPAISAG